MDRKNRILNKISYFLDILMCLLFLITTLSKGGFYKEDVVFPTLLICSIGFLCVTTKLVFNIIDNGLISKNKWITFLDTLVVLLPVSYFLPIIFGKSVSLEHAISENIKYMCFAIIYFLVRSSKNTKLYTNTIILTSCIIAIFGIDELTFRVIEKLLPNSSIRYLSTSTGALSSILQYANISALFMLIGSLLLKYELFEEKHSSIIKGLSSAIITILDVSIVLTLSRMNLLLLIIANILIFIYYYLKNKPINCLKILIILVVTMVLSGYIETNIYAGNFLTVILILVLMAVLAMVLGFTKIIDKLVICLVSSRLYKKARLTKRKIAVIILVLLSIFAVIAFIPVNLKVVYTPEEDIKTVSRKIYDIEPGKTTWSVKLKNQTENSKYDFTLFEILKDNSKNEVFRVSYEPVKNGQFSYDININENVQYLELVINVFEGDVEVLDFKIGEKHIYLSHFLVSDNMLSKIIETFKVGENNEFRTIYYEDAIKLIKESPIVGIGGEGFKLKYQSVQDIKYVSSEVHSTPLQIGVEAGLVGITIYIFIVVATIIVGIKIFVKSERKSKVLWLILVFTFMIVMSSFDLVGSFSAYTLLMGLIIGIIVNEYRNNDIKTDSYVIDNKSKAAMVKICILSICMIILIIAGVYEYRVYKASLIKYTSTKIENEKDQVENSFNKIVALEQKLAYDKYNSEYMIDLYDEYEMYITMLEGYVLEDNEDIKREYLYFVTKQKDLIDSMVKYEYYNKYVIDKVANCYFNHYIEYSKIFNEQFKDDEIAYSFYLSYAIKMLKRIKELAPNNTAADNMYYQIIDKNISRLDMQGKTLNSESILEAKIALVVLKEEGVVD